MITSSQFHTEIMGQTAALDGLLALYASADGRRRLASVPSPHRPTLIGMGASYHGALFGAHHLQRLGFSAVAVEATDALYSDADRLAGAAPLIYISQSGFSGEIAPILETLPAGTPLAALTNDEHSYLARHAQVVLPLLAGDEQLVATKTYINSLAILWLLARQWQGTLNSAAFDDLRRARDGLAGVLAEAPALAERWVEQLGDSQTFVYIGSSQQAATARQAAMMTMEWLKLPALSSTVGAFRHGPIEIAQPGLGVVVFTAPGPARDPSLRLAQTLRDYGASVLVVEKGAVYPPGERASVAGDGLPNDLSPLVDVVPAQLFVEALARQRGISPGFRHIDKVATTL